MKAFVTSSTAAALTVATLMHGHLVPSVNADGAHGHGHSHGHDHGHAAAPAPSSSYGAPSTSYGAPSTSYGAPSTSYGAPESSYGAPSTSYGAPESSYGAPSTSYGTPETSYGAPESSYGAPAPSYGAPAPVVDSYGAPVAPVYGGGSSSGSSYVAPAPVTDSYGSPVAPVTDSYGAPVAPVYGAPVDSYLTGDSYHAPADVYHAKPVYGSYGAVVDDSPEVIITQPAPSSPLDNILFPIAALSILGAATVGAITSPIWLPAVTAVLGRKKRDVSAIEEDPVALKAIQDTEVLESFFLKQSDAKEQADQLLANYLSCSGLPFGCLERLACINGNPTADNQVPEQERKVLQIVMEKMQTNVYLASGTKAKLAQAAKSTRSCKKYQCPMLDNEKDNSVRKMDYSKLTV